VFDDVNNHYYTIQCSFYFLINGGLLPRDATQSAVLLRQVVCPSVTRGRQTGVMGRGKQAFSVALCVNVLITIRDSTEVTTND